MSLIPTGCLLVKVIELNDIKKSYDKKTVLNGISLSVEKEEFLGVIGESGAGKSTLINIIGMLDHDYEGEYLFMGERVSNLKEKKLSCIRNEKIGFVFQMYNLVNMYTVRENILLPKLYSKDKYVSLELYDKLLESLHIKHLEKEKVINLSGGEKQRVAIARAAITSPKVIIADEPTGNLDPTNTMEVMGILKSMNKMGTAVIMVSHDSEAIAYADRVVNLKEGMLG